MRCSSRCRRRACKVFPGTAVRVTLTTLLVAAMAPGSTTRSVAIWLAMQTPDRLYPGFAPVVTTLAAWAGIFTRLAVMLVRAALLYTFELPIHIGDARHPATEMAQVSAFDTGPGPVSGTAQVPGNSAITGHIRLLARCGRGRFYQYNHGTSIYHPAKPVPPGQPEMAVCCPLWHIGYYRVPAVPLYTETLRAPADRGMTQCLAVTDWLPPHPHAWP